MTNVRQLRIMQLTDERAREVFRELGTWFGPPCIAHSLPVSDSKCLYDGRVRYDAFAAVIGGKPPVIVARETRQAARLLALCGHPDRAAAHVPDVWRDSVQSIAGYCGLSEALAIEVMAAIRAEDRIKRAQAANRLMASVRQRVGYSHGHANMVREIRAGLRARDEGESFDIDDVARIVRHL